MWSLAFVLIVLRFRPTMDFLDNIKWLSESVRVINARAITIYLWHFPLITLGALVLEHYQVPWATFQYIVWMLVLETVMVIGAVLVFGWVEDVSAKRRPSLWPRLAVATPAPAAAATSTPVSRTPLSPTLRTDAPAASGPQAGPPRAYDYGPPTGSVRPVEPPAPPARPASGTVYGAPSRGVARVEQPPRD